MYRTTDRDLIQTLSTRLWTMVSVIYISINNMTRFPYSIFNTQMQMFASIFSSYIHIGRLRADLVQTLCRSYCLCLMHDKTLCMTAYALCTTKCCAWQILKCCVIRGSHCLDSRLKLLSLGMPLSHSHLWAEKIENVSLEKWCSAAHDVTLKLKGVGIRSIHLKKKRKV